MTMEGAVRQLPDSARLAIHVQAFERVLAEEREKRARFYDEVEEGQKAEFINGAIIVPSPVKKRHHDTATRLLRFAHLYAQIHDLGFVGHEKIMISLTRNDYEPDVCFFGKETAQAFSPDQMKFPAPAFVAEVLSPSTEAVDRGVKFEDYAAHGVGEYWLLDPDTEVAEQYVLEGDRYVLRMKSKSGQIESAIIAGLSLPVEALFDDGANLREVPRLLQAG